MSNTEKTKKQSITVKTAVTYSHREGYDSPNARMPIYYIESRTHESVASLVRAHETMANTLQDTAAKRSDAEQRARIAEEQLTSAREELKKLAEHCELLKKKAAGFKRSALNLIRMLIDDGSAEDSEPLWRVVSGTLRDGIKMQEGGIMTVLDDILKRCNAVIDDADAADRLLSNHATDPRAPFMLISTKDARAMARALKALEEALEECRVPGRADGGYIRAAIERRLKEGK